MPALSKLIKTYSKNTVSAAYLNWFNEQTGDDKDDSEHADGFVHPSAVAGCPVWMFLRLEEFPIPSERHDPRGWRIFSNGDGVHERIQRDLCCAGILEVDDFDESQEVPMTYEPLHMRGHTDGVLNFGPRVKVGEFMFHGKMCPRFKFKSTAQRAILEIKSIKGDDDRPKSRQYGFNSVMRDGPKDDHIIQTHCYMKALNIPRTVFIYENKNTQEWFECSRNFDPAIWKQIEENVRMVMRWRKEYHKTKKLPDELMKVAQKNSKNLKPWEVPALNYLRNRLGERNIVVRHQEKLLRVNKLLRKK